MRDLDHLRRLAAGHGAAIGDYAAAPLDHSLPCTKMRQVYALLGLVKKWGPERVDTACERAAEVEAYNVGLMGRMLGRATEADTVITPQQGTLLRGRFARASGEFAATAPTDPHPSIDPGSDSAS